jgi:hypothetical protein
VGEPPTLSVPARAALARRADRRHKGSDRTIRAFVLCVSNRGQSGAGAELLPAQFTASAAGGWHYGHFGQWEGEGGDAPPRRFSHSRRLAPPSPCPLYPETARSGAARYRCTSRSAACSSVRSRLESSAMQTVKGQVVQRGHSGRGYVIPAASRRRGRGAGGAAAPSLVRARSCGVRGRDGLRPVNGVTTPPSPYAPVGGDCPHAVHGVSGSAWGCRQAR